MEGELACYGITAAGSPDVSAEWDRLRQTRNVRQVALPLGVPGEFDLR